MPSASTSTAPRSVSATATVAASASCMASVVLSPAGVPSGPAARSSSPFRHPPSSRVNTSSATSTAPAELVDAADVAVAHEDDPVPRASCRCCVPAWPIAGVSRTWRIEISPAFLELRPDVLAAYRAWPANDRVIAVDYFRSEAEARGE